MQVEKIESCWVKCGNCSARVPSGIAFGDVAAFEAATTAGNRQQCVNCGHWINCDQSNMSYVLRGSVGGQVGPDFGAKG